MKIKYKLLGAVFCIMLLCGCTNQKEKTVTATSEPMPTVAPSTTPAPLASLEIEIIDEDGVWVDIPEPTPIPIPDLATDYEVNLIAWTMWGEYYQSTNLYKMSTIGWCILNRVDAWGRSIESIVTEPNQFYPLSYDCPDYCYELAADVVYRWEQEHAGIEDVGRTLPKGYMWYGGDGATNWMRNAFSGSYNIYYWWLENPYDD